MKKILSYLAGAIALIGSILLFFRSKPKSSTAIDAIDSKLEKQANTLKQEIKQLEHNKDKSVEDKSLEDEIKYWEEQNKGKLQ